MPSILVELTANIVSAHAAGSDMTSEELLQEIEKVYGALKKLDSQEAGVDVPAAVSGGPAMSLKKAFQNDQISCLICGKTGFKTLTRHLKQIHDLKPGQYRKQFNIPSSQSLTAKNYTEARRKAANEMGLADNLAKARAVRAANNAAKKGKAAPKAAKSVKAVKVEKAIPKKVKAAPKKSKA